MEFNLLQLPRELRNRIYRCCMDTQSVFDTFELVWPLLDLIDSSFKVAELERMIRSPCHKGDSSLLDHPSIANHGLPFTCQQIFEEYKEEYRVATGHGPFVGILVSDDKHRWNGDPLYYLATPAQPTITTAVRYYGTKEERQNRSRRQNQVTRPRLSPPCHQRLPYEAKHVRMHVKMLRAWREAPSIEFLNQFHDLQELQLVGYGGSGGREGFVRSTVQECNTFLGQKDKSLVIRIGCKDLEGAIVLQRDPTHGSGWSEEQAVKDLRRLGIEEARRHEQELANQILRTKVEEIKEIMVLRRRKSWLSKNRDVGRAWLKEISRSHAE